MNALAGLKNLAKGQYGGQMPTSEESRRQERGFEESLHYVLTYGSHADILTFLMRREELRVAQKATTARTGTASRNPTVDSRHSSSSNPTGDPSPSLTYS